MQTLYDAPDDGRFAAWSGVPSPMDHAHGHHEIEINVLQRGAMTYLLGGRSVTVQAGDTLLFWAAIPHQLIDATPDTFGHWVTIPFAIFVSWALPPALHHPILIGDPVFAPPDTTLIRDADLCRQWATDLAQTTPSRISVVLREVEARLHRLAADLAEGTPTPPRDITAPPLHIAHVNAMAAYLIEHAHEPLQLQAVADAVGLHLHYAMTIFKRVTTLSMGDYLTRYRLAHAQRLLATTDVTVASIAYTVGFGSVSQFYAAFGRVVGVAPHAYRQRFATRGTATP